MCNRGRPFRDNGRQTVKKMKVMMYNVLRKEKSSGAYLPQEAPMTPVC